MLAGILMDARQCNERDGVTGALVCRQDIYLQYLEGPEDKVSDTYGRIRLDDRHAGARLLVHRPVSQRMFADWAMLHDPAKTVIWTRDEVSGGILDRLNETEIIKVFENLAANA